MNPIFDLPGLGVRAQVRGYDRVTLVIDRPELPGPLDLLEAAVGGLSIEPGRRPYDPQWQATVDLRQPSRKALRILADKCLGTLVRAQVAYVEVAWDFIVGSKRDAKRLQAVLSECLVFLNQRDVVHVDHGTVYAARRTDPDGDRRGRVGVMYSDVPSKLSGKWRGQSCVHIECRLSGSDGLSRVGISSVSDLLAFKHSGFWDTSVALYVSPTKTELGRLLGGPVGDDASGTALRKRADRFREACSVDGQFFMHNAIRRDGDLVRRLERVLPSSLFK